MDQRDAPRLAAAIADLTQGPGATPERCRALLKDFDLRIVKILRDCQVIDEPSIERSILCNAHLLITDDRFREAIANALGFISSDEAHVLNLTERRNRFLRTKSNVTVRTLIRHERGGALDLAEILITLNNRDLYPVSLGYLKRVRDDARAASSQEDSLIAVIEGLLEAIRKSGWEQEVLDSLPEKYREHAKMIGWDDAPGIIDARSSKSIE